ncbi:MAG: hypothetical protein EOO11_19005 [Chitinophagaceae bacterium]|nr:MAG: hypothetical protein EOO11_19005 [Chitinophagaceae bacterium]
MQVTATTATAATATATATAMDMDMDTDTATTRTMWKELPSCVAGLAGHCPPAAVRIRVRKKR